MKMTEAVHLSPDLVDLGGVMLEVAELPSERLLQH